MTAPPSANPAASAARGAWRAVVGGSVGAVVGLPIVLTLGLVAMAPVGASALPAGVLAAFACVVVSAAAYGLAAHGPMPAGGPSSPTALLVAALVARVVGSEARDAVGGDPAPLLSVTVAVAGAVMVAGALQTLMAALRVGSLVRVVPQPVLAGFMNGVALLILVSQLPALLALPRAAWQSQGWQALAAAQPGALVLGLGTAGVVWGSAPWAPRVPAALVGLAVGVAAYHALAYAAPGLSLGTTLGTVDPWRTLPGLAGLASQPERGLDALQRHAAPVLVTGVLLALIATLESMLNIRSLDEQFATRHDQRRQLLALGWANLLGGAFGALPMIHSRARAAGILLLGGRGRPAAMAAAFGSAFLVTLGLPLLAALPQAVLAGVMLTIGVSLVDRWSAPLWQRLNRGEGRRAVRTSLAIMALVCGLTVWRGPAVGVGAGMLLSTIAFVHGMNRSLVRSRRDGLALPSRRVYRPELEALLAVARRRIVVLELGGALFFGSAERVSDEAEALPADVRFLVLDLRRIGTVDDSAAASLSQLRLRLARRGVVLLLAGAADGSLQRLHLQTFMGGDDDGENGIVFADSDRAVEHAELRLLAEAGVEGDLVSGSLPLTQSTLLRGLSPAQAASVVRRMQTVPLRARQLLFEAGDPGNGLYVLTQGSVSVIGPGGQRYVSFSPATMLGEIAMLDGQGRSATAVADCDSVVNLLTREALDGIAEADPALCALLYRNIALHLAQRLRVATEAWRRAAD